MRNTPSLQHSPTSEDVPSLQLIQSPESTAVGTWEQGPPPTMPPRPPLERAMSAVRRYRWLIVAVFLASLGGGVVATRFVHPLYDVHATIWIQAETPMSQRVGAFKSEELLNSQAWVELLKSPRVADAVVTKLALYLSPANPADSVPFRNFAVADRFAPGRYELQVDRDHKTWRLNLLLSQTADSGSVADSLGKAFGFRWVLPAETFQGTGTQRIPFTVSTPRETALDYANNRLQANLPSGSTFLRLTMAGPDPKPIAHTMNAWMHEYVDVAQELKKQSIVEYLKILSDQLSTAEQSLHDAENKLEQFKASTITLDPGTAPIAPGIQQTTDPAISNYFSKKFQYDDLKHDREALERILSNPADSVSVEAALLIPSVAQIPSAQALRDAFAQLNKSRADLATARQAFTDNYPIVRDLKNSIDQLQAQTIPQLAQNLLTQLKVRESEYQQLIAGESQDIQKIPARAIEEARLRRQVDVQSQLYGTVKTTFTQAQLSEASTTPDVTILDSAIAPLSPSTNTASRLILLAVVLGLGGAIGLALLLDSIDGRIRYPEQVTGDLGIPIAAAIPRFPRGSVNTRSPEQVAMLIEAFRSLRMHVRHVGPTPIAFAVSSPQPGDGKSFVSANLAMSFADAGYRTVLVDGDTRRGMAHEVFGLPVENGLTDYLGGQCDVTEIIRPTSHAGLGFVSCGRRRPNSPELLTSAALPKLVAELRSRFDIVLFDTPPLNAGIDAFAVGTAVGSLVMVFRAGRTQKKLAAAKLLLIDRLPIQLIGAVLNAVQLDGEFQYYGYAAGYGYTDQPESESTALQKT